ncbi:MAG: hypothetical protein IPM20_00180 [Gammaproteobacteria bacterium]|nr:hypothetical protein [Gammaproteobacteria bacterium]
MTSLLIRCVTVMSLLSLAACGGGGGGGGDEKTSFTVGGTVSGLVGTVQLQNNGGDTLSRSANGRFTFATALADGDDFDVTVLTQPSSPNQTCVVGNGSGTVDGDDITGITVSCTTNAYAIGGTIGGLIGTVELQNNGGDTLSRSANGGFTFATGIADGAAYDVTVVTQPSGPSQTCVAANATGTVSGSAVTDVDVTCVTNTYTIGGTISGLAASTTIVLQNNSGDALSRSANGGFTFPTAVADGSAYNVTVQTQPAGQVCTVSNGSGTLAGVGITGINVTCVTAYTVGGTISGLDGTVTLQNNGGDDLPVSIDGSFTFVTGVANGGAYDVTVLAQPTGPNQTCVPASNSGTVNGANVASITITCTTNTYAIGGAVSGLSGTVTLRNNGGDDLTLNADGSFTFPVEITDGTAYAVTVLTQPADQICTVSNGSGTLGGADVTDVAVACINSYSVGGTVSGLIGTVQLQNNGGDTLSVSANGLFTFTTALADGASYSVTVLSQPTGQVCAVSNGTGVLSGADVTGILVDCAPVLNMSIQGIKTFRFTWTDTVGETEYRLLEDPDGSTGYSQIDTLAADTVIHDLEVFLPGRVNARYILQACNGGDCVDSAPVNVSGTLEAAVGYVKASNTNASDNFGSALALSSNGTTLAVGAPNEDTGAANSGAVYVFTKSGSTWSQQAFIQASNAQASDFFGTALALSGDGNTLAVGAPGESSAATGINGNEADNSASNSGAAYVFTRSAGNWTQQAYLKASNTETGDRFGIVLALSADGDTLAVAAIGEDSAATDIDSPNDTENCITPFSQTNCAEGSGAVYVFTRSAGTWSHQAYVKASNTQPSATDSGGEIISTGENFGNALALSENGNTLAVGAWHESGELGGINPAPTLYNKAFSGAAYVFVRDNVTWSQQAYLKAFRTDPVDEFGYAVALSADGNTLAVGADGEDSKVPGINVPNADLNNEGQLSGAAYVFTRSGTDWSQEAYIKASNTESNTSARDFFGRAVALSADGATLAVGAPGEDSLAVGINGNQADNAAATVCDTPTLREICAGAAYVFTRGIGGWSQQAYVKASNTEALDGFGNALALSGDGATLAAAATLEDGASTDIGGDQTNNGAADAGAVYLY